MISDKRQIHRLNSKQLRVSEPTREALKKIKRREIYIVCDNILDTYNIGSIFRLADAAGVKKIYLCGDSEVPPNIKISRAAVGTDRWVEWEYALTAVEAIVRLRKAHPRGVLGSSKAHPGGEIRVIAIEQSKKSIDYRRIDYKEPVAFVVGHETTGISKEILKACDMAVEIPMYGVNVSLNVMVSLAIVLWKAIE